MLDRLVRLSSEPLSEALEHFVQRGLRRLLLWTLLAVSLGALSVLGLVYLFNGVRLLLERSMLPGEAALIMAAIAFSCVAIGALGYAARGQTPRVPPLPTPSLPAVPPPPVGIADMVAREVQRNPMQSAIAAGVLGVALGANPELSKQLRDLVKGL